MNRTLRDYCMIAAGTFLLAYAVVGFWQPATLVTGGLSGITIIIAYYSYIAGFEIPLWFSNLVLNIPLFAIGYKTIPKRYFFRSIFAYLVLVLSLFLANYIPAPIPATDTDMLLAAVFGAVIAGVGIGLVFRACATTGGSTLVANILQRNVFRQFSVAKVLFVIDTTIIISGFLVFGPISAMYAVIAVFVSTKVTDAMVDGINFSKAAFIISKESEPIADAIMQNMERGCTLLPSTGMFTKQPGTVLLCVVSAKEVITLKQLVYSLDEHAFVIMADVREVLGEGFKSGMGLD